MGDTSSNLQWSEEERALRRDRRQYPERSGEGGVSEPRRPADHEQSLDEAVGLRDRRGCAEPAGQVGEAENEGHGALGNLQADRHPVCSAQSPARPEPHGSRRAAGEIRQRLAGGLGGAHVRLQGGGRRDGECPDAD